MTTVMVGGTQHTVYRDYYRLLPVSDRHRISELMVAFDGFAWGGPNAKLKFMHLKSTVCPLCPTIPRVS